MILNQNQTLLEVMFSVFGTETVLSVFDLEQDEPVDTIELIKQRIPVRNEIITAIQNQSLLDLATQVDGCVLSAVDYAIANDVSISSIMVPGQKIKMPQSIEFRYEDLANYFKSKRILIATYFEAPTVSQLIYEFPGEFPFSF